MKRRTWTKWTPNQNAALLAIVTELDAKWPSRQGATNGLSYWDVVATRHYQMFVGEIRVPRSAAAVSGHFADLSRQSQRGSVQLEMPAAAAESDGLDTPSPIDRNLAIIGSLDALLVVSVEISKKLDEILTIWRA